MKEVSVIIPCYNSGEYLMEAVNSAKAYNDSNYEIIIVDDGSTDPTTVELLSRLNNGVCRVFHQENQGPAAARNAGVRESQGEFLLFLDSDNRIRPSYIPRALEILRSNAKIGVVYANPSFFGDSTIPRFQPQPFDLGSILFGNYIDMCAVVRKRAWEDGNGFDENRILIGHEDWDFWINLGLKGWGFYYIDDVLFDYRIRENSLLNHARDSRRFEETKSYICNKYATPMLKHYRKYYNQYLMFRNQPVRSFLKYFYFKYILRKTYMP
jgi:glycosyltransferase involved in cell wall biosynthesis